MLHLVVPDANKLKPRRLAIRGSSKELPVPFSDPFRAQDHIDEVRKVGRLAQVLLDLRAEYEHKPRPALLEQIVQRIDELATLRSALHAVVEAARVPHDGTGAD
ncbi:MAG TPA: hypothetical protein VM536_13635 [Chloroflexia bacterium]|nr:hypothetical protein [Chloroflexia bacterium]